MHARMYVCMSGFTRITRKTPLGAPRLPPPPCGIIACTLVACRVSDLYPYIFGDGYLSQMDACVRVSSASRVSPVATSHDVRGASARGLGLTPKLIDTYTHRYTMACYCPRCPCRTGMADAARVSARLSIHRYTYVYIC